MNGVIDAAAVLNHIKESDGSGVGLELRYATTDEPKTLGSSSTCLHGWQPELQHAIDDTLRLSALVRHGLGHYQCDNMDAVTGLDLFCFLFCFFFLFFFSIYFFSLCFSFRFFVVAFFFCFSRSS